MRLPSIPSVPAVTLLAALAALVAPLRPAAGQGGGCTLPVMQLHQALATIESLPLARRDNYTFEPNDPLPRAMRAQLARVGEVVRSAPAVRAHQGDLRLEPRITSGWEKRFPWTWPTDSGPYFGYYSLSWYGRSSWGGPCALKKGASWDGQLVVVANAVGTANAAGTSASFTDSAGDMFIEPRVTRRIAGLPVYEDRVLIVTNISRPMLIPVSVERVLRAQMADLRKAIAESRQEASKQESGSGSAAMTDAIKQLEALYEQMRKTDPKGAAELKTNIEKMRQTTPAVRDVEGQSADTLQAFVSRDTEQLRRLERHLASLSRAERGAQAYLGGKSQDEWGLARAGEEGAYPLVSYNPKFFDRAAPHTALQLLALIPRGGEDEALTKLGWEVLESLDYASLRRLMTR